jgi:FkbM family methyltransferase
MSYFEYAKSIFDKDLILKDIIVETEDTSLENFTYGSLTTHLPYSVFSHSFEGSDLIAQSLLRNVSTGMYVDVGAFHPKHLNNTYNFYLRGWSGIAIDADPSLEDIWVSERPRDRFIPAVLSDQVKKVELHIFSDKTMNSVDPATISRYAKRMAPSDVSVKTLNSTTLEILKDKYFPRHEIHLLSIDIEGEDLKCLIGANLKFWRPGLIVVETKNLSLYNISNNEIVAYLTSIGYRLIAKNLLDAFFIDPKKSYFEWIPRSLIY